jgi:predicted Zn-dependent protease
LRCAVPSFRAFATYDRVGAQPRALHMRTMPAGGFAELARRAPLGADGERQLRPLNGVYAGGRLAAGQCVKVVD